MAQEFVELTIYPSTAAKQDLKEMDPKAAKVAVGTGKLYILDSRITPGKSENESGKIEWIKFEVKLKFHSGMNMTDVLDPAMRVPQQNAAKPEEASMLCSGCGMWHCMIEPRAVCRNISASSALRQALLPSGPSPAEERLRGR